MCKYSIKYEDTVIYKLCSKDPAVAQVYIGSTTNLGARRGQHKRACVNPNNKSHNDPKYEFIRANGGWAAWEVVLVEAWPCSNFEEQRQRERHWFDIHADKLNAIRPYRSIDEAAELDKARAAAYYECNKDARKAYAAEYRGGNKDAIKARAAAHYECNKDSINARNAAYYECNKDALNAHARARYQANKLAEPPSNPEGVF